ncbi:MAG: ferredoxin family protein [Proteobacteria bacterium]|nr:ferredoxin family protein [Pseudomonadota bacterium]
MSKKVYQKLTDKIMLSGSKIIPELFKMVADNNEAELLLAMPGKPEQLAAKLGKSVSEVDEMCQGLYYKGLVFKSFREGSVGYKMCKDMVQFHDATILWPEAPKSFHDLWQEFMDDEWPYFARFADRIYPKPVTRVLPVNKSIETGAQQILDADSVNKIIESAEILAVTKCTCRLIANKCSHPLEVCIQVDNGAKYNLDRGTGREIDKEEALKILRECEENGLVHVTMNKSHSGHFICNCCDCCCQSFTVLISDGLKICDPSRYVADIDPELCESCGTCLERCYFNALEEIEISGKTVIRAKRDKCMGCGLCQITCPQEAINLRDIRPSNFIPTPSKKIKNVPKAPSVAEQLAPTFMPVALRAMKGYDKLMKNEVAKTVRRALVKQGILKK